jgi:rhamnopyranosyl-N-acetylglucosaminyl-diphospho-decaprenol beta-1,3/1,4-galactofuranosyltransferase
MGGVHASFRRPEPQALPVAPTLAADDTLCTRPRVTAIIVSRDRIEDLRCTVAAVTAQAAQADLSVIIVDSSLTHHAAQIEEIAAGPHTTLLRSAVNLGGAGGFALGLLSAIAAGAEWIWLMDDDGRPMGADVLSCLLHEAAVRGLDAVAPIVIDAEDPAQFAFPYLVGHRYVFRRDAIAHGAFLPAHAHLFNGLLIRAQSIFKIGLPDLRLFIRGDEIDFLHRMRRAKLAFGTVACAAFAHPSSNGELFPVFWGRLHVVYPAALWKRRNQYRNRAYNFFTHRMYLILAIDFVRYPYFFLVKRRFDWAGLRDWLSCTWAGLCGDVHVEPVIDLSPRVTDLSRS